MCDSPLAGKRSGEAGNIEDIQFPCGKCPACKLRRVNDWVFRLVQEDRVSTSAYFVTLTYENIHVPRTKNGYKTLVKTVRKRNKKGEWVNLPHEKSIQAFIKKLREENEGKIKYYACGEYGEEIGRPHYHAIIFNIDETEYINLLNQNTEINNKLEKIWGWGHVHVGNVTQNSIAYTVKYIDKGLRVPEHKRDDREKEFSIMSQKLGHNYIEDQANVAYIKNNIGGLLLLPNAYNYIVPRYYRRKIYNKSQEMAFRKAMEEKQKERERKDEIKIKKVYSHPIDIWEYTDMKKIARHNAYYKHQKNRNGTNQELG